MKSVFFKNFLRTSCVFCLSLLVLCAALFVTGRAFILSEKRSSLEANVEEVEHAVSALRRERELNDWGLRMTISSIGSSTGNHVFLCDRNGVVVSCSDMEGMCEHIGRTISEEVCAALVLEGEYEARTSLGGFYDTDYFVVARPLYARDNRLLGFAFVSFNGRDYLSRWGQIVRNFILIAAVILCVMLVAAWLDSRRQAAPLREMAQAAHRFAKGDFSARVSVSDEEDEIGELTTAFNHMAEELERNENLHQEFISNVSHELRTPMTTIAGFADGILDGTIPPGSQERYLRIISSETSRLSRLVREMLEASRLKSKGSEELNPSEFDISELLVRTLLNFEERVNGKSVDIRLELPEESVRVLADEDSITRVIYNLLDNALKFCDEGSELSLAVWKENNLAYVSVTDAGPTIPREELPLIFDRFHKTDRSRGVNAEGSGLGLYMVRAIIDAHDQNIFVTSDNGITTFTFTLNLV